MSSSIYGQRRPRLAFASAHFNQWIFCPQTKLLDSIECFNRDYRPGREFAVWCESVRFAHSRMHCFAWRGQNMTILIHCYTDVFNGVFHHATWNASVQSNFDGLNIFGTIENCSRHGWFEPLRVNYDAKSGSKWRYFRIFFFDFLHNNCMFSVIRIVSTHNIQFHDKIRTFP